MKINNLISCTGAFLTGVTGYIGYTVYHHEPKHYPSYSIINTRPIASISGERVTQLDTYSTESIKGEYNAEFLENTNPITSIEGQRDETIEFSSNYVELNSTSATQSLDGSKSGITLEETPHIGPIPANTRPIASISGERPQVLITQEDEITNFNSYDIVELSYNTSPDVITGANNVIDTDEFDSNSIHTAIKEDSLKNIYSNLTTKGFDVCGWFLNNTEGLAIDKEEWVTTFNGETALALTFKNNKEEKANWLIMHIDDLDWNKVSELDSIFQTYL